MALALGDEEGRVVARVRRPTEPSGDPDSDLERLVADGRALLTQAGLAPEALQGVGVSFPGPLDADAGVVHSPPNLPGWAAWMALAAMVALSLLMLRRRIRAYEVVR